MSGELRGGGHVSTIDTDDEGRVFHFVPHGYIAPAPFYWFWRTRAPIPVQEVVLRSTARSGIIANVLDIVADNDADNNAEAARPGCTAWVPGATATGDTGEQCRTRSTTSRRWLTPRGRRPAPTCRHGRRPGHDRRRRRARRRVDRDRLTRRQRPLRGRQDDQRPRAGGDRRARLRVEPGRPHAAQRAHERHRHPRRRHRAVQRRTAEGRRQGAPRLRLRDGGLRRRPHMAARAGSGATSRASAERSPTARSWSPRPSSASPPPSPWSPSTRTSAARRCRPSTPRTSRARSSLTEHLLALGHRRIGFLAGRPDLESARRARPATAPRCRAPASMSTPNWSASAASRKRPPPRRPRSCSRWRRATDGDLRRQRPLRHPDHAHRRRARDQRPRRHLDRRVRQHPRVGPHRTRRSRRSTSRSRRSATRPSARCSP